MSISKCTCIHEGQDKLHSEGMRVFNPKGSTKPNIHTCTVCGLEKLIIKKEQ